MAREKKQAQEEDGPSAPLWMVTFSDCMNLLLTFFVLLVTFSSFDTQVLTNLGSVFKKIFPETSPIFKKEKFDNSAFLQQNLLMPVEVLTNGSEKPALAKGQDNKYKQETYLRSFDIQKVFLVPSKNIFWGKGSTVSADGKKLLLSLALFLKEMQNRIIISENGPDDQAAPAESGIGLRRAYAVVEYLTAKQGLDKKRFNISASSTQSNTRNDERTLEIVLLERSIYD
jgi:chemotaxis protein MotB